MENFIFAERVYPTMNEVTKYRFLPEWVNSFGKVVRYEYEFSTGQWGIGHNFDTMHFLTTKVEGAKP